MPGLPAERRVKFVIVAVYMQLQVCLNLHLQHAVVSWVAGPQQDSWAAKAVSSQCFSFPVRHKHVWMLVLRYSSSSLYPGGALGHPAESHLARVYMSHWPGIYLQSGRFTSIYQDRLLDLSEVILTHVMQEVQASDTQTIRPVTYAAKRWNACKPAPMLYVSPSCAEGPLLSSICLPTPTA